MCAFVKHFVFFGVGLIKFLHEWNKENKEILNALMLTIRICRFCTSALFFSWKKKKNDSGSSLPEGDNETAFLWGGKKINNSGQSYLIYHNTTNQTLCRACARPSPRTVSVRVCHAVDWRSEPRRMKPLGGSFAGTHAALLTDGKHTAADITHRGNARCTHTRRHTHIYIQCSKCCCTTRELF